MAKKKLTVEDLEIGTLVMVDKHDKYKGVKGAVTEKFAEYVIVELENTEKTFLLIEPKKLNEIES